MSATKKRSAKAGADPIFAAIEQYKSEFTAFNGFEGTQSQFDAAAEPYHKAQATLLETVPTTLAGMKAKISFCMNNKTLSDCLTNSVANVQLHGFLNTLYKSARIMVA